MNNIALSPQAGRSIRTWSLIGAAVLAVIEIIWYILIYFWLGSLVYSPLAAPILDMSVSSFYISLILADVLFACLPVLIALPVFFWISQQIARRTGLMRAGTRVALHACGWWIIIKVALFYFMSRFLFGLWVFNINLLLLDLASYILAILLMFGAGWWMGTVGGRSGSLQSAVQSGYSSPQPAPFAPAPGAPLGISQQQPIPQPLSALEILQQRFARGEIDQATYQQMRAQLEASARPHPNAHQ
ncbi:MAG TPA: SHOCT domain-containing protein [Ktedonobacteraceae bacterium]|nr:SHOCT domain-containing protein [Ktedonobacteraceae bacterium]